VLFASNCGLGSTIPLEAAWSGTDLPATVTLDGRMYTQVGSLATVTAADVRFSGSLVAPAVTNRVFQTATAPFALSGKFVHTGAGGQMVTDTFTVEGVAKVWLVKRDGGTGGPSSASSTRSGTDRAVAGARERIAPAQGMVTWSVEQPSPISGPCSTCGWSSARPTGS
jgi:hypothetical protein